MAPIVPIKTVKPEVKKRKAKRALPKKIVIGAVDYAVRENLRLKAENTIGQILYYESVIEMQNDLSPAMRQLGLWHETLHGLLIQGGFREHDERLLDVLSAGIVRLLKDNPCLRDMPQE